MEKVKKAIKIIIVLEKDNLLEITDIRKVDFNTHHDESFYNNNQLDQVIYTLCRHYNLNTKIKQIDDNKIEYIINDKLCYKTRCPLTKLQIDELTYEFNREMDINNKELNEFIYIHKFGKNQYKIPTIQYIKI